MILTCPNCGTRFLTNADDLGDKGRPVRCGKCQNVWFADPPAPLPDDVLTPEEAVATPVSNQVPALHKGVDTMPLWRVAAAVGSVWIILLLVLVSLPKTLSNSWPPITRLYETVGYTIPVVGEGLVLADVDYKLFALQDKHALVINGAVINTRDTEKTIPNILIRVQDSQGAVVKEWLHVFDNAVLPAQQKNTFYTQQVLTGEPASRLTVKFSALSLDGDM